MNENLTPKESETEKTIPEEMHEKKPKKIFTIIGFCIGIIIAVINHAAFTGAMLCILLYGIGALIDNAIHNMVVSKSFSFKKVCVVIAFIAMIGLTVLLFVQCTNCANSPPKSKYEDVFKKDPNKWTQDEKDYVNDFFDWQKDYQEKQRNK